MKTYRVTWEIDIGANSEREAASTALKIQRDKNSWAVVFDVQAMDSEDPVHVDLAEEEPRRSGARRAKR